MEELLPCAHCGGEAKLKEDIKIGTAQLYSIGCTKCLIRTMLAREDRIIKAWNRRVSNTNNNDNWGE